VEAAEAAAAAIKSPRVVGANDERASGRGVYSVILLFKIYIIRSSGVCGGGDTRRRGCRRRTRRSVGRRRKCVCVCRTRAGRGRVCVRPVYPRDDAPRCTADGLRAVVAGRARPVRVPRYSFGVVHPHAVL